MAKREGGAYFWWVFGPLWTAMILAAFIPACTVQPSSEHWLLRVTTIGGAVLNEVQGEGCEVDKYTGRVWVGGGNHYNNATYVITNNAPNVVLSCTKLP